MALNRIVINKKLKTFKYTKNINFFHSVCMFYKHILFLFLKNTHTNHTNVFYFNYKPMLYIIYKFFEVVTFKFYRFLNNNWNQNKNVCDF